MSWECYAGSAGHQTNAIHLRNPEPSGSLDCGGPPPLSNSTVLYRFFTEIQSERGLSHSKALRAKYSA
jgi:hypothetical protein